MAIPTTAVPMLLKEPGFLWIAAVGVTAPTNTVAGSVFTDVIGVSYFPLGPTQSGSTFTHSTSIEPMRVAELPNPIEYAETEQTATIAFALADFTLSNYRRAINGGVAALAATSGSGATSLGTLEPPALGASVRSAILWESTDSTVRLFLRQCLQGGEVAVTVNRAPAYSVIPCTFNAESPSTGAAPWTMWTAGENRLA